MALGQRVTSEIPCVVRLDKVTFIDSTGIGLLVRLQKKARLDNQPSALNLDRTGRYDAQFAAQGLDSADHCGLAAIGRPDLAPASKLVSDD